MLSDGTTLEQNNEIKKIGSISFVKTSTSLHTHCSFPELQSRSIKEIATNFKSLHGFGGYCLKIAKFVSIFEPCFKV